LHISFSSHPHNNKSNSTKFILRPNLIDRFGNIIQAADTPKDYGINPQKSNPQAIYSVSFWLYSSALLFLLPKQSIKQPFAIPDDIST